MLTPRILNPSYGYQTGGYVSFHCQMELFDDSDPSIVLDSIGLSVTTSFLVDGWVDRIKSSCKQQADEYIMQFQYMMALVNAVYPSATKPQDACDLIAAELATSITI